MVCGSLVESREAALREPGDIVISGAKVAAKIGELLGGGVLERWYRPVIFRSVGVAVEDIAAAKLVNDRIS
jgi:ornithine cyclodeaminase/alanine dehydrogenase-like protein (mu-crystallin family)